MPEAESWMTGSVSAPILHAGTATALVPVNYFSVKDEWQVKGLQRCSRRQDALTWMGNVGVEKLL